ncbi:hypothetical protein EV659_108114 [Rhodothalassium salexigens DSM 2132]|uniref:Uncharacterized protein n=1 Tax=Rhodothalassium salexigens DSM 2132 TaxID=1188247 RepID=A0A4R2PGE9_RHOSA|nr:hypothetical protein [Rhodothalassium salexigens]MBB4212141.1 hypothetical protein [Rhodothalassium salexigens DSM 2132]MBK1638191.1 hypothetical protein [Rhodothalassium salexigens DSM 2132]TCP33015.1 hypothetical protein EV659_108114 [Rhodothalassium salexigens DSM 2132]
MVSFDLNSVADAEHKTTFRAQLAALDDDAKEEAFRVLATLAAHGPEPAMRCADRWGLGLGLFACPVPGRRRVFLLFAQRDGKALIFLGVSENPSACGQVLLRARRLQEAGGLA